MSWRLVRQASRRLSWGVADQAMSSVSNFAVNIYIARTLGAVQYGAFALAYVTYGFALNASRGLGTDPLLVRFSGTHLPDLAAGRHQVHRDRHHRGPDVPEPRARGGRTAQRHGPAGLPRARADAARTAAAGQLAIFVLRAWTRQPGIPQRHDLDGGAASRPGAAAGEPATRTCSGSSSRGAPRRPSPPPFGPLQARVAPRLSGAWEWVSRHRDLGPRYLAEGTANSASEPVAQLRRRPHPGPGRRWLRAGRHHADGSLHGHLLRHGPGHVAGGGPDPASLATAPAAVLPAA